jgi:hypothetical protein
VREHIDGSLFLRILVLVEIFFLWDEGRGGKNGEGRGNTERKKIHTHKTHLRIFLCIYF